MQFHLHIPDRAEPRASARNHGEKEIYPPAEDRVDGTSAITKERKGFPMISHRMYPPGSFSDRKTSDSFKHMIVPMLAHDCARTCNLLPLGNHNTIKEEAFVPVLRCGEGGSGRATKPATRTLCRARDVSASLHLRSTSLHPLKLRFFQIELPTADAPFAQLSQIAPTSLPFRRTTATLQHQRCIYTTTAQQNARVQMSFSRSANRPPNVLPMTNRLPQPSSSETMIYILDLGPPPWTSPLGPPPWGSQYHSASSDRTLLLTVFVRSMVASLQMIACPIFIAHDEHERTRGLHRVLTNIYRPNHAACRRG